MLLWKELEKSYVPEQGSDEGLEIRILKPLGDCHGYHSYKSRESVRFSRERVSQWRVRLWSFPNPRRERMKNNVRQAADGMVQISKGLAALSEGKLLPAYLQWSGTSLAVCFRSSQWCPGWICEISFR